MKVLEAVGGVVFAGIFLALLLMLGPALLIWAVNTFAEQAGSSFQIPFNFWTWLSGFVLLFLLKPGVSVKK